MTEIVIAEFMDEKAVRRLADRHETIYDPELVDAPRELRELVSQARALIVRNRTQVRGDLLAGNRTLECVGRLGVGLDNIDITACKALGITVYPATGANDLPVAEYVVANALMLMRRAYRATALVASGKWPRPQLIGREISGKVIGLIGYGSIAREVARRAEALGMKIIAFDPYLDPRSPIWRSTGRRTLDDLLGEADVVSLHVPLNRETRHMIDTARIALMKPGAIVINAARGGVIDERALVAALRTGRLGGAALDVFEAEPLDEAAGRIFSGIPNLILTPHIAGVTQESNIRVSELIADRVLAHLKSDS